MISRTLTLDGTTVQVTFKYDYAPGPGIAPGWDPEETGAWVKLAGNVEIWLGFEPTLDTEPADWLVPTVQCNLRDGRRLLSLAWEEGLSPQPLSKMPEILRAVETVWAEVRSREAIDLLQQDLWETQEEEGELHHILDEERYGAISEEVRGAALTRLSSVSQRIASLSEEIECAKRQHAELYPKEDEA